MEEQKKRSFPLKVILQDFFSDHRQKAYICVKEHWTSILDLQNHIINLFNLSHEVFITDAEGYLFPAQESIDIVQQGGAALTVHRQTEPCKTSLLANNGKTFKSTRNSTPFTNGGPPEIALEITETPIVGIPPPKENGAVLPEVREQQKRRKRVRKRKKNNQEVQEDSSSVVDDSEKRKRLKGNKTASHIRFAGSEDGDEENESALNNMQITETPLGQSDVIVSRTLHKTTEKSITEDANGNCSKSFNRSSAANSFALEELRERLPDLDMPTLKKLPKKDDVIAFKLLKMGETYEPILSNFIIGIVESVRKEKNEVSLLILSGEEELKEPQGKFSLPETPSDHCDELVDDDLLTVNFSNLQEVRRLDLTKLGATF